MTALVGSIDFCPSRLSDGAGVEVIRPIASVVIAEMVTSSLLTLIVLPTQYGWIEGPGELR